MKKRGTADESANLLFFSFYFNSAVHYSCRFVPPLLFLVLNGGVSVICRMFVYLPEWTTWSVALAGHGAASVEPFASRYALTSSFPALSRSISIGPRFRVRREKGKTRRPRASETQEKGWKIKQPRQREGEREREIRACAVALSVCSEAADDTS